jgi:hypothetical protein
MTTSAYALDRRVVWNPQPPWLLNPPGEWPRDVFAIVADQDGVHDGWVVMPDGAGFMTRRAVGDVADLMADDRRGFGSVDEAIRDRIGEPK